MSDCIFCKITRKEVPAEIVYEDEASIAFLDINPVNFGHLLVIPKEHHAFMQETPDSILSRVFVSAKKLMPAVQKATNSNFVAISVVGIDVPHFHVHLIPRSTNDGLKDFWPSKKYDSSEQMKETAEAIRNAL